MATNVFDLFAKISLDTDGYEKGLEGAKSKFSKFGEGLKSAAGKIGDVLAGIGKTAAVGIGAAGTALTALTKQSLDVYANFEQLEGGTKLMFGSAADFIIEKSEEAYKTVQLSQNEYLQQVNGFAVGLKTALGGNEQAAAELADKIVQAEADIVAATGNTQEMVQNAFNGIMRSNYTMLDNLGLGIKPTKEGMEEVIEKVNEWNAANGKATSYVIDNLADVQAALVDYIEMQGMAGYASMEAGSTITGSIAGVKAAWQNFLSGNGNIKDFTDMLIPTVKNIRDKLSKIIPRLTEGLTELADALAPEIPALIEDFLPIIISGASTLLEGLAERLPQLVTTILPSLAQGVVNVSVALVQTLPQLVTSLKKSIPIVVDTIMEKKDELLKAGKDIIKAIFPDKLDTKSITDISSKATAIISQFMVSITNPEKLKKLTKTAVDIVNAVVDGLLSEDSLNALGAGAEQLLSNLGEAIKYALIGDENNDSDGLFGAVKNIIVKIGDYFADEKNRQDFWDSAYKALKALASGIKDILEQGVAPLMVEIARTWMELFIGKIDYNDAALDIIQRLGEAFIHNMVTGGVIGAWIERSATDYVNEMDEQVESDNSYDVMLTAEGMRRAGVPQAGIDAYIRSQQKHETGFYANRPTLLTNDVVGENGDEVLLPLDSNTGWMDKLADKLGSRMSGGVVIESVIINTNSRDGADIADSFVERLSEKLSDLQGRESRGYGLGYIGGSWQ